MMKTVRGDLLALASQGHFDLIIHGCNCFCNMGAGIARAVRETFPEAYLADLATGKGDRKKLGSFSWARISGAQHEFIVINGYTQFHHSGPQPLVDYQALRLLFTRIKKAYGGKSIAYPKIGAGLAGGDWDKIAAIISAELSGEDHTLVLYEE
jgi:O-acetyl-ADP-ribose deacetylase (regulator of RNase III)